ncbi:MAG: hypothetical protein HKN06_09335 [Gammaproteobacteria bacterium]|nr:hypothetical protein [Gammaproteobacteria bacterium]
MRIAAPTVQLLPGSNEAGNFGATSQPVITEMQWNDSGQLLATIDAEGNVVANSYYPANDPDGDGVPSVTPLGDPGTAATGYVETSTRDAANSPRRTSPVPPVQLETHFSYDAVGNIIATRNPRGVVTTVEVNQLNEPVVITRGADVTEAAASGQLITGEAPFAYQLRNTYDYNGRVILREIENRDGNTAGVGGFVGYGFTYDILNRLVTRTVEIDSDTTLVTQYRYDANENLVSVTQPEGNETRSVYDERDLLFTATRGFGSPDTSTTQRDYDLNGNPERFIDAADNDGDSDPEQTITAYDGFDRVIQVTDALGNFIQTSYDPASNAVQQQVFGHPPDSPGSAPTPLRDTRTAHDELNRVFQTDQALFLAAGYTTLNPVNLLDDNSDGFVTDRFEYDALSRPTFRVEDDGEVTQTVYDGASRMISTIDALGNRTDMQYDQNSNVVLSSSVELSPEALVPDETFTTRNVYDQLDRLVRTTDNIGQTSYYSYDSRDNLIDSRDAQAATLPDPLGVFPGDINVPGNSTTYVYDGLDRRIQAIYDLRVGGSGDGALDTSNPANPDGQVTRGYTYDGNSRLTGMSDDKGNTTSFGYDALDRRISQANADLTAHAYSYDGDDNLVQSVDPNASVVINTYDAINRLVQVDISRGSGVAGTTRQTYSYDGLSRLTASSDDNGDAGTLLQQTELVYDSLSRVLEERQNGKPVSRTFSGDGDKLSCTYPGGRTLTHTYDAIDRVKLTSDGGGLITDSNWIGPGYRELRRLAGNGTSLSYLDETDSIDVGYDGIKRVVAQQCLLADGTTAFMDRGYDYNRANQRLSEHRFDDGNLSDEYVYDSLYRITTTRLDQAGMRGPGATRGVDEITYQLDGVGNRTEVIATVDPTIVDIDGDGLVGAADNCLEVANPDQRDTDSDGYGNLCDGDVDNSGAVDLQDLAIFRIFFLSPGDLDTDLNGDGSTDLLDLAILRALFLKAPGPSGAAGPGIAGPLVDSYTSNEMNEYDEITGATRTHDENGNLLTDGTRTFSYDYRDRLVSVSDGSRGPLSNYLYYADNRRAAKDAGGATTSYYYYGWQPVEERNAADQTIITYVWGPGDIDELVQFERSTIHPLGAGTFFAHQNVRSDVVSLTDAAGNLAETYRYDDFGNVEAPSALGNEFLFQGRRFDADTGLYYFRNRYHDPVTGRFLQRDPVSSDLDLGNRYAFVANQPASLRDPLGLDPEFYDPDRELTSRYADFALSEAGDEVTEKALTKVGESLGQAIGRKVKKKIQGKIIGGAATGGLYAIYDFVNDAAEASKQYRELAVSTYYDYISASDPEWEQRAKEERARYNAEIERWQDCLEEKRLKEADEKFSEMMALTVRSYQQENAPPTPRSPEPDNPLPENDQSPDLDEELRKRMSGSSRKGKSLAERLRGVESHAVE